MPTHLYLAPAAAGKTAYILDLARSAAQGLAAAPRVVVSSHLQVRAARRRLAEMGGAIGVRVLTFDWLCTEILNTAAETYVELSDPVEYRLVRALLDSSLSLRHYTLIADLPGFVQVLRQLIGELKAAGIHPEGFAAAVRSMGNEPRLAELGQIYAAYQARLGAQGWADRAGLGWLAVEALRERAPHVARDWPLLFVDGFDSFTPVQVNLLHELAARAEQTVITLTGELGGENRSPVHQRLNRTRTEIEEKLGLRAEPLPDQTGLRSPVRCLTELVAAADREGEVRAALRWLKARLLLDGLRPGQVALLARKIAPYRPFIQQTAAEFGLPIRLADGLPLRENPAVSALLGLLETTLPAADTGEPALPRRPVVEAWRSPYFDWSALSNEGAPEPIGIAPADADDLAAVARWGRVIGGRAQWIEALDRLAAMRNQPGDPAAGMAQDEEQGVPAGLPRGDAARALADKFRCFVGRLEPPGGRRSYREFACWLEDLVGSDEPSHSPHGSEEESTSLRLVERACQGRRALAERDVAALAALKDVLRGLIWAEEALASAPIGYSRFFAELAGAVDAACYNVPAAIGRDEILVAGVQDARGLPFRAVAILGLAEGEFPATLVEDPLLRDADRRRLRDEHHLPIELSTQSFEAEFFYNTASRPSERLLLTRPRLADDGAPWQASPFWEETLRGLSTTPKELTTEDVTALDQVASMPELMESLASAPAEDLACAWAAATYPDRWGAVEAATRVLQARRGGAPSPFDGDLSALSSLTADQFGASHAWSASRLENYRRCPFSFFVAHALGLEPREDPVEGLDSRQLGNIYHRILETLYRSVADPSSLESLLAALPQVAQKTLDEAPRREGFRESKWWDQTRCTITETIRTTVMALSATAGEFKPIRFEMRFWGDKELQVLTSEGSFQLHGVIDRVDRAPDGRIRVIDYKTSGPSSYTARNAQEGKLLQLPLYALAARDALRLGDPADGFYWHIQHAQSSDFTLAGDAEAIMARAAAHAWQAVLGARSGRFAPQTPPDGCPTYCAAASFCWRFRPAFRG